MPSRKVRGSRGAGWIAVAALGAILSGCASWTETVRTPEVETTYQPSDLPIPLNFDYEETESWAYVKFADPPLNVRSGKFVYYGVRPLQEISHWYLSQMPVEGWVHVGTDDRKEIHMQFRKGFEDAEITLERIADRKGHRYMTRLTARIRPSDNLENGG